MTDRDEWTDPEHPPTEATDLGGGVWASWAAPWSDPNDPVPMIWHWCPRTVPLELRDETQPIGTDLNRLPEWYEPRWVVAGVQGHDFKSRNPLHLEPSLSLPDCCRLHGHIRDGKWVSC